MNMQEIRVPTPLPYEFHDGILLGVAVGPRREVTLTASLDPVWQPSGTAECALLRFGNIDNFAEVQAFFARANPHPRGYFGRIDRLDYAQDEPSRANRLSLQLELEWHGTIIIRCRNLSIQGEEAANIGLSPGS